MWRTRWFSSDLVVLAFTIDVDCQLLQLFQCFLGLCSGRLEKVVVDAPRIRTIRLQKA